MSFLMRLSLGRKILLLLLLVALIPFSLTNIYWYINARDTVNKNAKSSLVTTTVQAADSVNNFLNTKLLGFLSHSQGAALLSGNELLIKNDLSNFLLQDPDLISLTFTDKTGQEIAKVDRQKVYDKTLLKNIKSAPEFKVPGFKFGKEYISSVTFSKNEAFIKISTPVVYPENSESLLTFSSGKQSPRTPGEVYGVLIGQVSLKHLQSSMDLVHIGKEGHISIIDATGNIIVHNHKNLIGTNVRQRLDPNIQSALNPLIITEDITPVPTQNNNLDNIPVLSTFLTVPRTKWVVLAEEPQSEISQDIVRIQQQAIPLFLFPFLAVIVLSYFFSNSLTHPIKHLVLAAIEIGKGNFDFPFTIRAGGEMKQLADSYHSMAYQLKTDRNSLIAERNTLSTVLETIADGVIGLNEQFVILFANKAASLIVNKTSEEIIQTHFDVVMPLHENTLAVPIEQLCTNPSDTPQKLQITTNDKKEKTIHLIIAKVPSNIVTPIKYILTMYDISKEQELEDMKIDFVSMAAHELRTPLTSMKGYLSLYIDANKATFTGNQKELIDRIDESTKRLGKLIESILKVTRIEKTGLTLDYVTTDWEALIKRSLEDMQGSANAKQQHLSLLPLSEKLPQLSVDQARIAEVVSNLLTNAIKYTPEKGTITVSTFYKDGEIVTSIADNGQGIPRDSLSHLFTKFYRVPGKLEQTTQGTGLGLYITKEIIELHHGKIWAQSTEGKGSTFTFSLPLNPPIKQV